jgi:hypothetical protein
MPILTVTSPILSTNPLLKAAFEYAGRGWRVFPLHGIHEGRCTCDKPDCGRKGKHPRTEHGFKDGTRDEDLLETWWERWPEANVGIATGPASGFFMIGPDGQVGIDALAELERQHGPLPPTPRLRSGGGGMHYYFAWPLEGGIGIAPDHHGVPIDVRGAGGYVVAPPSRHGSGNVYVWEVAPDAVPLAVAPDWLLEWAASPNGTKHDPLIVQPECSPDIPARAVRYLEKCPAAISGNGGHDQTFAVARAVVYGFNLGPEIGFDLLWQHYNPRCVEPWSESELRHKCRDAHTQPFDKPRGYLILENDAAFTPHVTIATGSFEEDIEAMPMPGPPPWPAFPHEAFYGLAGEIVRAIEPHTEADPVGILGQLLVAFGNEVGRGPYFAVEGDRHYANLYLNTVGTSGKSRKGTAWGRVRQTMEILCQEWAQNRIRSGMASGEGFLYFVRDPIVKADKIVDEGVPDKRILWMEPEFSHILRVLRWEKNTLSTYLRRAWDDGTFQSATKNSPLQTTDAHTSVVGHTTKDDLIRYLDRTDIFNGFANRFIWLLVRRSKLLPNGGGTPDLTALTPRLQFALEAARNIGEMERDRAAQALWEEVYESLTAPRDGFYGAITARADPQVVRLSLIFSLFQAHVQIKEADLRAALAFWAYADESTRLIFGTASEDPLVELVLAKLRAAPDGMTRTELRDAFQRNLPAGKLLEALGKLRDRGDAYCRREIGRPGRPAERWFARQITQPPASSDSTSLNPQGDSEGPEEEIVII